MNNYSALITDPNRQNWFATHLPFVRRYTEADQEFFDADILFIADRYKIGERSFQIRDAWQRYLMIKYPQKILVIYTARQHPGKQCICLSDDSDYLKKRIKTFISIGERPDYPDLSTWGNLVEIVSKALVSHTENNLRSRIGNLRKAIQNLEENIFLETTIEKKDWDVLEKELKRIPTVWEGAYMYFRLFPFFQNLIVWQKLYKEILVAFEQKEDTPWMECKFSRKLSGYLENPVRYISEMYHFEPYE